MIGLDTNVLVRYFAQDDDAQSPIAARVMDALSADAPGYVSVTVLIETIWVLSRAYRVPRAGIGDVVERLLRSRDVIVEGAEAVYPALATYRATQADFADALIAHAAARAGCAATLTFDRRAAATTGMRLLGG